MCDDFTFEAEQQAVTAGVSRRTFGVAGTAAAMAAWTPAAAAGKAPALRETVVAVPTPDGTADAVFVHPAKGRHPAVVMWPDIAGIRDANKAMARRLAEAGFAVLLVNQYYRSAKAPVLADFASWRTPAGQERLRPMIAQINPEGIIRDGGAFVAWLDKQAAVDTRRGIGTTGYCMGGPFAVRTAFAAPARVGAVGSFHGGGLVTDKPDSPHLLLPRTRAAYLIAVARNDDGRAPADKDTFKVAATAAGRAAEVEVYAADHGWTVPDSPVYDKAEAERAWARLLALLAKL
ncbi:dienelactone hydrolase family protein [Novosphingobium piscinae]|uniref:Dienelactone hydrolase family protein n=1 Tax=Novosphingobium piscinae TaxID=1507448 RepID=A0A7X1KPW7_9SPHN|nr:dienelactone hydrolase family protein [Novosphingobium piscinae]MBC2669162.1 dienelactone hydrolase family protein [Novosphingobium piscinae]